MSAPAIAALAAVLGFAAAWELVGALEGEVGRRARRLATRLSGGRVGSLAEAARQLGVGERIRSAGLEAKLTPSAVLAAKAAGLVAGGVVAAIAAPALGPRLVVPCVALLLTAGFLVPDALLDRIARRRRERVVAALPDALDLLAVGAAAGRGTRTLLGEIAAGSQGPLADELAAAVAEIECGAPVRDAVDELRARVPGPEIGSVAAALERSRRYGSPLADQLHDQAASLRRDARRRTDELAARAAPKIQLVVALVLVPSALLAILATIVAHSGTLLTGF